MRAGALTPSTAVRTFLKYSWIRSNSFSHPEVKPSIEIFGWKIMSTEISAPDGLDGRSGPLLSAGANMHVVCSKCQMTRMDSSFVGFTRMCSYICHWLLVIAS